MSIELTIATIAPGLLNTNGDSENAAVLARRAEWAGATVTIIDVEAPTDLSEAPDALVIGSGSDSSIPAVRDLLLGLHNELRTWATEGVPILAVGLGWELLSWGIEYADGTSVEGLGLLPGRAVERAQRVTDDIVVASKFGRLVGFENSVRDYIGAEGSPIGRLSYGVGNGRDAGQEGVTMGDVVGTHLHGPVLALNPGFADQLLTTMFVRAGAEYVRGESAIVADDYARAARNHVARKLSLTLE